MHGVALSLASTSLLVGVALGSECKFAHEGSNYDLSPLQGDSQINSYKVIDSGNAPGSCDQVNRTYYFKFCEDVGKYPASSCEQTSCDFCPPEAKKVEDCNFPWTGMSTNTPPEELRQMERSCLNPNERRSAYQVDYPDELCYRLGDDSSEQFSLIDASQPAKGIKYTYKNGETCELCSYTCEESMNDFPQWRAAPWNGKAPCVTQGLVGKPSTMQGKPCVRERQLTINLYCEDDAFNLPDNEPVVESPMCNYEINLPHITGCPIECPRVNNLLCGGHGVCDYDEDKKASRCFCNEGFYGADCSSEGSGNTGMIVLVVVISLLTLIIGMMGYVINKMRKLRLDPNAYTAVSEGMEMGQVN